MTQEYKHEFTVDRAAWRTATRGIGLAMLLNEQGYRCCLGFMAQSLGVPDATSKLCAYPTSTKDARFRDLMTGNDHSAQWNESRIAGINDSGCIVSDDERERRLAEAFEKLGIKVNFTGEYKHDRGY